MGQLEMLTIQEDIHLRIKSHVTKTQRPYEESSSKKGYEILFKGSNFTFTFTIGEKWFGYELIVVFENTKKVSIGKDTDNYPVDGSYREITMSMFEEGLNLLRDIDNRKIYYGMSDKTRMIALPKKNSYEVTKYRFFSATKSSLELSDLIDMKLRQLT